MDGYGLLIVLQQDDSIHDLDNLQYSYNRFWGKIKSHGRPREWRTQQSRPGPAKQYAQLEMISMLHSIISCSTLGHEALRHTSRGSGMLLILEREGFSIYANG